MRWYLIKTWAGKEEELVREIRRSVPSSLYKECFAIYHERIWRKQQRSIVHREMLFPGCVFLTCEREKPLPGGIEGEWTAVLSRIGDGKGAGIRVLPMMKEEGEFLERLSGQEHMVKLSCVLKDDLGNICKITEPLKFCQGQIERMQWKKRYAMVRRRLWGEEQVIVLGIVLKEDMGRELDGQNKELLDGDRREFGIDIEITSATKVPVKEMA